MYSITTNQYCRNGFKLWNHEN